MSEKSVSLSPAVLEVFKEHLCVSSRAIADMLGMSPNKTANVLSRLVKGGYIVRFQTYGTLTWQYCLPHHYTVAKAIACIHDEIRMMRQVDY